ncbi:hypothetical protein INR49_025404 [Caranx melampygus]|nr:hypothetical protein INR49_025404 [Caranx melampygus]
MMPERPGRLPELKPSSRQGLLAMPERVTRMCPDVPLQLRETARPKDLTDRAITRVFQQSTNVGLDLSEPVPCYSYGQKLSKLAILRIACNYILSLAQLAELDYSSDHSSLSFSQCVEQCTRTLQAEGRSKKRKSLSSLVFAGTCMQPIQGSTSCGCRDNVLSKLIYASELSVDVGCNRAPAWVRRLHVGLQRPADWMVVPVMAGPVDDKSPAGQLKAER